MLVYRLNPSVGFCSCKAYAFSKPTKEGRKHCKHLDAVGRRGVSNRWYVFKVAESRWIAPRENEGFVGTDMIDFYDIINGVKS